MTNREAYRLITTLMEIQAPSGTKLEHAKNQTLKNAAKFIEAYNDKLEDLNIEYCSTDERGNILRDARGQYVFTKENQRLMSKELKKFMDSQASVGFDVVSTADRSGLVEPIVSYLIEVGFVRNGLMVI